MNQILEYSNFKKFFFDDDQNSQIVVLIRTIMKEFYGNQIYGDIVNIDNQVLKSDLLRKSSNNFLLRNRIILDFNLSGDFNEFINFLKVNKFDLFNIHGKYFDRYYELLFNSSKKGTRLESIASDVFKKFAESKGLTIKIVPPTFKEDKSGIDLKFELNKKIYTIQVKPLKNHVVSTDFVEFYSEGDTRKVVTDYFILTDGSTTFIIRSKGGLLGDENKFKVPINDVIYPNID